MKNRIEELATIITLVKGDLKSKENALVDADSFTSHFQSSLNNAHMFLKCH